MERSRYSSTIIIIREAGVLPGTGSPPLTPGARYPLVPSPVSSSAGHT